MRATKNEYDTILKHIKDNNKVAIIEGKCLITGPELMMMLKNKNKKKEVTVITIREEE